jgi:hypothetical protein
VDSDSVSPGTTNAEEDKYATKVDVVDCAHDDDEAPLNVNSFEHVKVEVGVGDSEVGASMVRYSWEPEFENWAEISFGAGGDTPAASTTNIDTPCVNIGDEEYSNTDAPDSVTVTVLLPEVAAAVFTTEKEEDKLTLDEVNVVEAGYREYEVPSESTTDTATVRLEVGA